MAASWDVTLCRYVNTLRRFVGTTVFPNVYNNLPKDTAEPSKRLDSSASSLWEIQISRGCLF